MWTDGRTDGRDEGNGCFSPCCQFPSDCHINGPKFISVLLVQLAITVFIFIFISYSLLSSLQLSSTNKLTTKYTQQPFFVSLKYCCSVSARRPSIVEVARLSSGTPHHCSHQLSATSLTVRCHSAVKPLSLFIRVGTHSQT